MDKIEVTRPISNIEHRTPQEVFDIMCARFQAAFSEREARLVGSLRHVTDCLVVELGNLANEDETDDADLQGILGSKYAQQVIAARLRIRQARATLAALKDQTDG